MALAGGAALAQALERSYKRQETEKAYEIAVEKARLALNDRIARSEHALANLRLEMERKQGWKAAWIFTETLYALYADALARFARQDWAGALPLFQHIGELPGMAEAWHYAGLCRREMGEDDQAALAFRQASESQAENLFYSRDIAAAAHAQLADLHAARGDWEEALAEAEAAIDTGGESADLISLRGEILLGAGRAAPALAAFRAALAIDPESPRAAIGAAQALAGLRREDEALEQLERAARTGRINLSFAAQDERFEALRQLSRFRSATALAIGHAIDWGPFSDKIVLTNRNPFALTQVVAIVKRKNRDEAERAETLEAERLDPGQTLTIKGAIASGPKSRTEYFAYELGCKQGTWSARDDIGSSSE
ncbi:MAG: Tetratricopeptide repeat protein [candidate division BRC1 bacterium ADurb.BinA364]|nr:MAG: Tetratricopeptide repeat protein [candidate division BRC1 bacterium ADurb.BinA364]